jgi:hypothetical protein
VMKKMNAFVELIMNVITVKTAGRNGIHNQKITPPRERSAVLSLTRDYSV